MGRLQTILNPYFLPSSFASAEQECVSKQQLEAVFAEGTFCDWAPIFVSVPAFSTGASYPVCPFSSHPFSYSCPSLLGWQSSSGFLCLVSHSPRLQMNCTKPGFL